MMKRFNNFKGQSMFQSNDLQDLDRELELLRRKRQIIEQQQYHPSSTSSYNSPHNINPWEQSTRNDYNQGRSSFSQPDYADLYDSQERPNSFDRRNRRKRVTGGGPRWQEEPSAKRFRGQQDERPLNDSRPFKRQNQFGSRANKPSTGFRPPQKNHNQSSYASPASKRSKGLNSSTGQAAKPNPASVPKSGKASVTKPGRASVPKPGQASGKASQNVQIKEEESKPSLEKYVLENKSKPPKKVAGRLEFALGVIFKKMKARHENEPCSNVFDFSHNFELTKLVKQVIRNRIREALYMKEIRDISSIISEYEVVYPDSTDQELIDQVMTAHASMLKIEQDIANSEPDSAYLKGLVIKSESSEEYFKLNMTSVLQLTLTEMFAKLEKVYQNEGSTNEMTALMTEVYNDDLNKKQTTPEETSAAPESVPEPDNSQATAEPVQESNASENANETVPASNNDEKVSVNAIENIEEHYKQLLDGLIKQELPKLLPKFKDDIIRILELDQEYCKAKVFVHEQTSLLKKYEKPTPRRPFYFVMIIGNPKLPKKGTLQAFLHQFSPSTVKKHRNIFNVLYVGFADKENFDNILKNDDAVVDDQRLTIKESKRIKPGDADSTKDFTEDVGNEDLKDTKPEVKGNTTESLDEVIDADLDGQINDLLNNIRHQEECIDRGNIVKCHDDSVQLIDNGAEVINLVEDVENDNDVTFISVEKTDNNDEGLTTNTKETAKNDGGLTNNEETANNVKKTAMTNNDDKTNLTGEKAPMTDAKLADIAPNASPINTRRSSRLRN